MDMLNGIVGQELTLRNVCETTDWRPFGSAQKIAHLDRAISTRALETNHSVGLIVRRPPQYLGAVTLPPQAGLGPVTQPP